MKDILSDLVKDNLVKDIRSLYINKDNCWEFINAHREVSVTNVAEIVSKLDFFSILMDESKLHGKKKKMCIHSAENNSSKEKI